MVNKDPLIAFSWYFSGRVRCVFELGSQVLDNLDTAFAGDVVDGGHFARAEMIMWFWVVKLRLKPSSEKRGWWFEAQLHWATFEERPTTT